MLKKYKAEHRDYHRCRDHNCIVLHEGAVSDDLCETAPPQHLVGYLNFEPKFLKTGDTGSVVTWRGDETIGRYTVVGKRRLRGDWISGVRFDLRIATEFNGSQCEYDGVTAGPGFAVFARKARA